MSDYINWTSPTDGTNHYSYNGNNYNQQLIYYTGSLGHTAFQQAFNDYTQFSWNIIIPKGILNKNIKVL